MYWLFPFLWMGVIYYSSAQPYQDQDVKPLLAGVFDLSFLVPFVDWVSFTYHHSEVSVDSLGGIEGFIEFFVRKGAHVGVFFVLMVLFYNALSKTIHVKLWTRIIMSFSLTVPYAILDEFHQSFTANRTPYAGDVLLDGFGAMIAVLCVLFFLWIRDKKWNQ